MNRKELQEIIAAHGRWIRDEPGGEHAIDYFRAEKEAWMEEVERAIK